MTEQTTAAAARLSRRALLPVLAVALFALIVAMFAVGLTLDSRKLPSVLIDQPVPTFDLPPLLAGKPGLKSDDLKGRVSLVNVWASWCVPCRVEHPVLMRLAREGKVAVVGINWKDRQPDAEAFLKDLGDPFARIGADPNNRVGVDWGVYGVPESYLIDRQGRIRYKVVGPISPDELKGRLMPLIESLGK
ncbi:MAG: DsbE family thiol:disulfide interchange protein [Rhodospirillales bacterium]